jgi:hypothetical protein
MRRITMGSIYKGDICKLEQEKIKDIVDNIRENLPMEMKEECWKKMEGIIYFTNLGKITKRWDAFLKFVSSHSKRYRFDKD